MEIINRLNRKIVIISAITVVTFLFSAFLWATLSGEKSPGELVRIVKAEGYAEDKDLAACDEKDQVVDCLSLLNSYLVAGIELQTEFIKKEDFNIEENLAPLDRLARSKNIKKLNKSYLELLTAKNNVVTSYLKSVTPRFNEVFEVIRKHGYKDEASNLYINNDWAILTVVNEDDTANIILKKEATWNIVLGPGTSFEKEAINKLGIPKEIEDNVNIMYVVPVIKYNSGRLKKYEGIHSILRGDDNTDIENKSFFPYYTKNMNLRLDVIEGKETIVITIYFQREEEKEEYRDFALKILQKNGIDTKKFPPIFKYLFLDTSM